MGLLGDLLRRLVMVQEASAEVRLVESEREVDACLKLDRCLVSIGAQDEVALVEELEAFEKQMSRVSVDTWRQWYRYFEQALTGRARVLG